MKSAHQKFHGALPQEAQRILMRAAQTPVTAADPLARTKAIEKATQRIKTMYPDYFQTESDDYENHA
jgi:hypothetical protein